MARTMYDNGWLYVRAGEVRTLPSGGKVAMVETGVRRWHPGYWRFVIGRLFGQEWY